jgi:hypothetical protein
MKRVTRSDKPDTLLLLLWSHKCDFGAEPRNRIIATSAVKGSMESFLGIASVLFRFGHLAMPNKVPGSLYHVTQASAWGNLSRFSYFTGLFCAFGVA